MYDGNRFEKISQDALLNKCNITLNVLRNSLMLHKIQKVVLTWNLCNTDMAVEERKYAVKV